MTSRPIILSPESVAAILAGTKTQTRRVVKPQPTSFGEKSGRPLDDRMAETIDCPWGSIHRREWPPSPGLELWVREAWAVGRGYDGCKPSEIPDLPFLRRFYRGQDHEGEAHRGRWRSSIHMPRWASRLTLEVTAVRVERLQDISEHDAMCEGIPVDKWRSFYQGFAEGWDEINAKRGHSWESNPWVWVLEFEPAKVSV